MERTTKTPEFKALQDEVFYLILIENEGMDPETAEYFVSLSQDARKAANKARKESQDA